MAKFSEISLQRLETCDPRLQAIAHAAIERMDFAVLCGHRTEAEQNHAFELGNSRVQWPNSKHNPLPSKAMDLAPCPVNFDNIERFKALADVIKQEASRLGFVIIWGGDWLKFKDYDHFQIAE
jgi:peptidoglycan L-alanyl-D-glutamate endopeptidase CwlK